MAEGLLGFLAGGLNEKEVPETDLLVVPQEQKRSEDAPKARVARKRTDWFIRLLDCSFAFLADGGVTQLDITLVFRQGDLAILVGIGFVEGNDESVEHQRAGLGFCQGNLPGSGLVDFAEIFRFTPRGEEFLFRNEAIPVGVIQGEGVSDDQLGRLRAAHRATAVLIGLIEFLRRRKVGSRDAACKQEQGE